MPADGPEGAGLARRDVHRLRAFDPNSPDLAPPVLQPTSATAVCSLVTLAEAQKLVPAVSAVEPTINSGMGCQYLAGKRQAFYVTDAPSPVRTGPVQVYGGLDARRLVALAELLSRR